MSASASFLHEVSVPALKVCSMAAISALVYVFGMIPLKSQSFTQNPRLASIAWGFAGGLFLAIGVIHILPEANDIFSTYFQQSDQPGGSETTHEQHLPWAFITTVLSFTLILFLEKIMQPTQHSHAHPQGRGEDLPLQNMETNISIAPHRAEH